MFNQISRFSYLITTFSYSGLMLSFYLMYADFRSYGSQEAQPRGKGCAEGCHGCIERWFFNSKTCQYIFFVISTETWVFQTCYTAQRKCGILCAWRSILHAHWSFPLQTPCKLQREMQSSRGFPNLSRPRIPPRRMRAWISSVKTMISLPRGAAYCLLWTTWYLPR